MSMNQRELVELRAQRLRGIGSMMSTVQILAEQICRYVLELEGTGMALPAVREMAEQLSGIALGWAVGGAGTLADSSDSMGVTAGPEER